VSTGSNDKPLILLVDDSRVMRIALKKILQPEFDVVEASNGEAGWEALNDNPSVRCVFTDLAMPELDGFGLLERIRGAGESRIKSVPVIIITGNEDDPSMRSRVIEQGANDVVMKPFQTNDILTTTRKHLTATPAATAPAPAPAPRPTAPAPSAGAEAAVARLKSDLAAATARMREMEARLKEAEDLRRQLSDATAKQDELRRQLADEQARRSQVEAALRKAESEVQSEADMEAEVLEFQKQVDSALGRARQADEARKAVEAELERVRQEMMFRQQGGDRLKQDAEVGRLQRELEAAKKRADVAERVQADYEDEIARLKAEAGGGAQLQEEIVARQQAESRASRLETELADANRRAREAEAELARVGTEADSAQGETAELLRLEEEAHRQAEEQVQRLRRELELARKKGGEVESAQRAAEQRKSQLEHKVNQLEAELKILRQEGDTGKQVGEQVESLRAEIDALLVRAEAAELAQQEAENDIARMAVGLEAAEQAKRNAEHSVMRMTAQVNSMRKQVSQAEAQRTAMEQQLKEIGSSKEALKASPKDSREAPPPRSAAGTATAGTRTAAKTPAGKGPGAGRDELVEIHKPRTAAKRKLQDRFNDTIVAMWSRKQRGQRRMKLVIGAVVVIGVVGAAWYKGWWPFDDGDAVEEGGESPAAQVAPASTPAVAASPRPEAPRPAATPMARAPQPAPPTASAPALDSEAYRQAREARERAVRERARQEFDRLLAMSAPPSAEPAAVPESLAEDDGDL